MLSSIVYSFILLCLMTWIKPGLFQQSTCNCNQPVSQQFADDVKLRHFKCDRTLANTPYSITYPQPMLSHLDSKKHTVLVIHGFPQTMNSPAIQTMIKELCDGGKDNVVVLDWGKHSQNLDYKGVTFNKAQKVGVLFSQCTTKLVTARNGLDLKKFHIVAFSVGAHIAGFIKCNKGLKIHRITVLDPASPAITKYQGCYISSECARRVEMMHTDMTKYGAKVNELTASVHYIANNGTRDQPNCPSTANSKPKAFGPKDFCSHEAAIRYYAETVKNPDKYMATSCKIPSSEDSSEYEDGKKYRVGHNASPDAQGILCFKTTNNY